MVTEEFKAGLVIFSGRLQYLATQGFHAVIFRPIRLEAAA
jgi:hypothetical protein